MRSGTPSGSPTTTSNPQHRSNSQNLSSPLSCPALQLETPPQKRVRFSQQYKADGKRLVAILRALTDAYPRYAAHLIETTQRIGQESERTRESDRRRVLDALRDWPDGLVVSEIVEDTGLGQWDVRQILDTLVASGEVRERRDGARRNAHGRPRRLVYTSNRNR
jgi:hypothetical protein